MTLAPDHETAVQAALTAVWTAAHDAKTASDIDAAKAALNRVWFAVHDAQTAITTAERETRKAALDRLETARTFA